MDRKELCFR